MGQIQVASGVKQKDADKKKKTGPNLFNPPLQHPHLFLLQVQAMWNGSNTLSFPAPLWLPLLLAFSRILLLFSPVKILPSHSSRLGSDAILLPFQSFSEGFGYLTLFDSLWHFYAIELSLMFHNLHCSLK